MSKRKRTKPRQRRSRADRERHEWIGGRRRLPFYVREPEAFRPEILIWLEMPADLVVAAVPIDPRGAAPSFAEALRRAIEAPLAGPPRRPRRVRVEDEESSAQARSVLPGAEIMVAPAPELDRVIDLMAETMPGGDAGASYLQDGQVPEAVVRALFEAAERLYRSAPWERLGDDSVIGLDVPELGVQGACISVIGALGESLGFIVFPSYTAFEEFARVGEAGFETRGRRDLGATMLSLNFEQGAELPESLRREAAVHGWPVADTAAYPMVLCVDRDAVPRPNTEGEIRLLTACAAALERFVDTHPAAFGVGAAAPVHGSSRESGLEIRLTYPYGAGILFDSDDGPVGADPGRESGTGETTTPSPSPGEVDPTRALDEQVTERMIHFAAREFGEAWLDAAEGTFADFESVLELSLPWAIYHQKVDGKPLVRWFVDAERVRLFPEERRWLEGQQAAWVSIWEVTAVEPGRSLTLDDLLTEEQRLVQEVGASHSLAHRDVILARIVDHEGRCLLAGAHPRPLPPRAAAEVLRRVRGKLRRRGKVPVAQLRDMRIGRYAIRCWEEAIDEHDERHSTVPPIQNTDSDPLLLTVDHFEIDPVDRPVIEDVLAQLDDVLAPKANEREPAWIFVRQGGYGETLVGRVRISEGRLQAETNSVARADALRKRLEARIGARLRHRAREHSDPLALYELGDGLTGAPPEPPDVPPEELARELLDYKTKHYAGWSDQPLPALGGETARDAVKTRSGREAVELLLKEMENMEARLPPAERFDFSVLRWELGLES